MCRFLRLLFTTALAAISLLALTSTRALAQVDATPSVWAVRLVSAGDKRVEVVARVRAITGLGLKEANDLVNSAPVVVKDGASRSEAEDYASRLREVGASVSIIPDEPVSVPAPSDPPQLTQAAPGQAAFAVWLEAEGPTQVEVVKRVRAVTKLGLKESADLVKAAPTVVVDKLTRSSADAVAAYIREGGATVQVKSAAAPAPSAPPAPTSTSRLPSSSIISSPLSSRRDEAQQLDLTVPLVYDLVLQEVGPNRTAVMDKVRQFRRVGLLEARDILTRLPQPMLQGVSRADAELAKKEFDAIAAGAVIVRAAPPAAPAPSVSVPAPSTSAPRQPRPATPAPASPPAERKQKARKPAHRIVLQGYTDKNAAMLALRQLLGVELKAAKALVDSVPAVIRTGLSKDEAQAYVQRFRERGVDVSIEADR